MYIVILTFFPFLPFCFLHAAREKVGHALREAINKAKRRQKRQQQSSSDDPTAIVGSVTSFDEESITEISTTKSIDKNDESSIPRPTCSSTQNNKTENPSSTSQAHVSVSDISVSPPVTKKLKVHKDEASSLSSPLDDADENEEEEEEESQQKDSQIAWEMSLQQSNELFKKSNSFLDADDMIDISEGSSAASIAVKPLAAAQPVVDGPASSAASLLWKPPGAANIEESYMEYLNALQPKPIMEDKYQKKLVAGGSGPMMQTPVGVVNVAATGPMTGLERYWQQQNPSGQPKQQNEQKKPPAKPNNIANLGDDTLDVAFLSTAGLSNLVVDDDIF
jgi:hypothetical protein